VAGSSGVVVGVGLVRATHPSLHTMRQAIVVGGAPLEGC